MPNWRTFIVEIDSSFRLGRECAEGRTFRKIEGNRLSFTDSDLRSTRSFGTSTTTSRSSVNVCPIFGVNFN